MSRSLSSSISVPNLFVLTDTAVVGAGLMAGHWLHTGRWLVPRTAAEGVTILVVLGLYLGALAAAGGYAAPSARTPSRQLRTLGPYLAGAWALVLAAAAQPSFALPSGTLIVHGFVVFAGAAGARVLVFSSGGGRSSSSSSSSPAPGERPAASSSPARRASPPPDVQLEDLVPRTPVEIDRAALRSHLSERTVLVTGAGGSIGAKLSEQLLALAPHRLVLLDVSEYNLYQLETSLRSASSADVAFCLADVRNRAVMDDLLAREQPDLVVHTAAYKHVHLMERHPAEAFRNNTMATVHLHRLCERNGVDDFLFVSTDKAVHPSSVLGATKQWAEWYVRPPSSSMHTRTVRFGNVFGSQGSVVPHFEEKLAAGEPLPITHPDMERYFMTADEACRLLLQTILFDTHPVYLLQMGDPVRIEWLAERLIERWYPHVDPASMIEHVGPRPGEKLSEELVRASESIRPTDHPSIRGLEAPVPYSRETLAAYFRELRSLADPDRGTGAPLRRHLLRDEPTVRPSPA